MKSRIADLQSGLLGYGFMQIWDCITNCFLWQGRSVGEVVKAGAGEARSLAEATETLLRIQGVLWIRIREDPNLVIGSGSA